MSGYWVDMETACLDPYQSQLLESCDRIITLEDLVCDRARLHYESDVWLDVRLHPIPLDKMTTLHLNNALGFIEEHGPNSVWGLGSQWEPKLYAELKRRGEL